MRKIESIEVKKYSEPDERGQVRYIGMKDAEEVFEQLKSHLEQVDMLPDDYFLLDHKGELPDYVQALCIPNYGGCEGIYLDITLLTTEQGKPKMIDFATGKTLGETGDDFLRMSRIAAECSLMLNGRGRIYEVMDDKSMDEKPHIHQTVDPQEVKSVQMELQNFLQERLNMASNNVMAYSKNLLMVEPKDGHEDDWMTYKKEVELINKLSSKQDVIAELLSTECSGRPEIAQEENEQDEGDTELQENN